MVAFAIRHMYRIGIGVFSRRARLTTRFPVSMVDVPAHAVGPADRGPAGGFIYRLPSASSSTDSDTWHPEIAARVWATSRVAVLDSPTAKPTRVRRAGQSRFGALEIPPDELIGITGDAIYTTTAQDWMLPTEHGGGGGDGRTGRIRLKGWLTGPLPAPPESKSASRIGRRHTLGLAGINLGLPRHLRSVSAFIPSQPDTVLIASHSTRRWPDDLAPSDRFRPGLLVVVAWHGCHLPNEEGVHRTLDGSRTRHASRRRNL